MRLLQPGVAMATVSLLHGGERFLLVDTPKAHRAEDVHRIRGGGGVGRNVSEFKEFCGTGSATAGGSCRMPHPSSAPVIKCSSLMSWTQSMEPLWRDDSR